MALVLGRAITSVRFLRVGTEHNATTSTSDIAPNQWKRRERDFIVALAGSPAETRYRGEPPHPLAALADEEFVAQELASLALKFGRSEGDLECWRDDLARKSEAIVHAYWPGVEAVAEDLLVRRYLSGRRVRQVVSAAMNLS